MEHNLTELQRKLLPMLEWYHKFCTENNLRYYLLGGTMLGAARHQGFIPWDDDIDVGMPRKDYELFLHLTQNKIYNEFVVESIDTKAKDFYYGYTKIYDINTTLVENTRYKIKRGIYIDVFPLDGVGTSKEEGIKFFKQIFNKYRLLLSRTCGIRKGRKFYKNILIFLARLIPNFIVNNKKLMLSIDEMCKKKDYDTSRYIGNLYGNWGAKEIVANDTMGNPTIYKFENLEVYGSENFDAYLTSLYDDWRKLPPKEKQVTHHDFLECNLNKPYLER